jgi:MFS family permease
MAIGRLVGDRVVYRFGNVNVMRIGSALAAIGIGSAVLFPRAETALWGFGLTGFGYSCLIPIVFSAAGRSTHTNPGTALAAVTMSGYVGLMAGPPAIGFAAEVLTLRGALVILVGLSLIATVLARTVASNE